MPPPARITRFERRRPSGWPTVMHVVRLYRDELLIHSPTWIDDATFDEIAKLGTPRMLFAPNHFHHLSLARYRERFPKAIVVASADAIPRLHAKGHEDIRSTFEVSLPPDIRWLLPSGTKSGEAWISVDGEAGPTWIVGDAFFNEHSPVTGFEGSLLKMLSITPGTRLGATFKYLCVRDRKKYKQWTLEALEREKPSRMLMCHGDALNEHVAPRLSELLHSRL